MGGARAARGVAVSPLGEAQVTAELAQTPGWKRSGKAIERTDLKCRYQPAPKRAPVMALLARV